MPLRDHVMTITSNTGIIASSFIGKETIDSGEGALRR